MRKPVVRTFLSILFASIIIIACREKKDRREQPETAAADSAKIKDYFPVLGFLRGEMVKVDSLPGGILQLVRNGSVTDSSYVTSARVHELAADFLTTELEEDNFEEKYKETSFYDNTTQTSTFMYSANEPTLAIRRVDIISQASATYDKVLSIYMEKNSRQSDTTVIKKIQWQPGKQFQLVSEKRIKNEPISSQLTTVIWDRWSGSE